jgi:ubiquinone/menaquinone biosynthesis C-methylase UbiE
MTNLASGQPERRLGEAYCGTGSQAAPRHLANRSADQHAAFLFPHLRPGMELLDCGCGPGSITVGLARVVAPGRVVGIDKDASQVEAANVRLADQQVLHLRFETADIYALPFPDASFDAIYSNAVLVYLNDPLAALHELYRVLKPGGVIGIRNPAAEGRLFTADDPLLHHFWQIFRELNRDKGGIPGLGKQQRALLRQAGFVNPQASATYDCYGTAETTRYWGGFMAEFLREDDVIQQFVTQGLAERPELERMSQAWRVWGEQPDVMFMDAFCEAVGWKA